MTLARNSESEMSLISGRSSTTEARSASVIARRLTGRFPFILSSNRQAGSSRNAIIAPHAAEATNRPAREDYPRCVSRVARCSSSTDVVEARLLGQIALLLIVVRLLLPLGLLLVLVLRLLERSVRARVIDCLRQVLREHLEEVIDRQPGRARNLLQLLVAERRS